MLLAIPRAAGSAVQAIFCQPLKWIADKIRLLAQKIFGYILRVSVFQLGEYKRPFAYFIMRAYQKMMSDPREENPLDRERLESSKSLLLQFGGQEKSIPFSEEAQARCMVFTAERFFKHIEELGGQKREIILSTEDGKVQRRNVILGPSSLLNTLEKKFSLPPLLVQVENEVQNGILLPESPHLREGQRAPIVFHSHSPGRSMAMDRKFLGLHLGAGYDVCAWDPPGTIDSTGTPSEASYYRAAEAILQDLSRSYEFNRIYLSGYCEGAAVGAYLKAKYHREGIHFIAQNPFNSMLDMVQNQGLPGRLFGKLALPEIQAPDSTMKQNGFDLEDWFKNLPRSEGKFFLIHTDTDKRVPPNSIARIQQAIGQAGPSFIYERIHPNRKFDGHLEPPIQCPAVWHRYVEVVC